MLLDRVRDGDVKRIVLKGEMRGIALHEIDAFDVLFRKGYEIAVPVDCGDMRLGIPSMHGLRKRSRAAANLQNAQLGVPIQVEHVFILLEEHIVKSQLSAEVQRHGSLHML